jgi:Tol biopolymer transport system component
MSVAGAAVFLAPCRHVVAEVFPNGQPSVIGRNVLSFERGIGNQVVYTDTSDLFIVAAGNSLGTPINLTRGLAPAPGNLDRIAYRGSWLMYEHSGLHSIPLNGSLDPYKINLPDLDRGLDSWSVADNGRVIYSTLHQFQQGSALSGGAIYSGWIDGRAPTVSLTGQVSNSIQLPGLSADGETVAFIASSSVGNNLYTVRSDGGPLHAITGPNPASVVTMYRFTPDGQRVVFRGDFEVDGRNELFSAPTTSTGTATKISGTLVSGGQVDERLTLSPDGSRAIYAADQQTDNLIELYSTRVDGSALPVKLNGPLLPGESAKTSWGGTGLLGDGSKLLFNTTQAVNNVTNVHLYVAPADGSGQATPVATVAGNSFGSPDSVFKISPDESRLVYRTDQDSDGKLEFWSQSLEDYDTLSRIGGNSAEVRSNTYYYFTPNSDRMVILGDANNDSRIDILGVDLKRPSDLAPLFLSSSTDGRGVDVIKVTDDYFAYSTAFATRLWISRFDDVEPHLLIDLKSTNREFGRFEFVGNQLFVNGDFDGDSLSELVVFHVPEPSTEILCLLAAAVLIGQCIRGPRAH